MYLRIDSNQLIFRISRPEAESLLDGNSVSDSIWFSPEFELSYQVSVDEKLHECAWTEEDNFLNLIVNRSQLLEELESRPSKQGMQIPFVSAAEHTSAWLQIDLKTRR